ncbi:MAG: TonB-dependent receptor, partial [Flavobacteriales bacterium]|nr:TonB-dependent receptor [Flavobacteriales bacterium]
AFLSVETRDFPDELVIEFNTTFGYNSQTSFKNIVSSRRSDTDFWGYDNGYRDIPGGVPIGQENYPIPVTNPGYFEQFEVLGLGSFLNSYGITSETPIEEGDAFYQLAMTELGLLGPAQFYDTQAVNEAINAYESTYGGTFFQYFNSDLAKYSQTFNNDWFTIERQAPLDMSNSFSIGNELTLFKRKFGFMLGLRRSNNTTYDPVSDIKRSNAPPEFQPTEEQAEPNPDEMDFVQQVSTEVYGWSGLLNLAYQLSPSMNLGFIMMPNFIGENRARRYEGRDGVTSPQETLYGEDQYYEERKQWVYQGKWEYLIPASSTRIELNGAYTDGLRNVLDFRDMQYVYDALDSVYQVQSTFSPDRRYRFLDEDMLDTRISIEHPLNENLKLKVGAAYQRNERHSSQVMYSMQGVGGSIIEGDVTQIFAPERFSIAGQQAFDLYYLNGSTFLDNDMGIGKISAAYAMADVTPGKKLRLVGGIRVEHTDLIADIERYHELGLEAVSDLRVNIGGVKANPGIVDTLHVLPSMNLIYNLITDSMRLINLRVNYFRSLARPSFRELSAVSLEDYEFRNRIQGNPDLEITDVNNYDLRLESYFASGTNVSLSVFYKQFKNHIELLQVPGGSDFTWQNADKSNVLGVELEGKVPLTSALDVRGNLSWINSQTTVTIPVRETRAMFGQAPWIVNGMLTYAPDSSKWSLSVSYNVQGPKIAVVANSGENIPDIYEMPRQILDANLTWKPGKHYTLGFQVRNIMNAPVRRTYKYDSGWLLDFDRFTFGPNYLLSFSYSL